MRFKEFALKVYMVFINRINHLLNMALTYEHQPTFWDFRSTRYTSFCLINHQMINERMNTMYTLCIPENKVYMAYFTDLYINYSLDVYHVYLSPYLSELHSL